MDILLALSPLDVGQGAVVAGGLCLGIETLQGTDALLRFVGDTPDHLRRGKGGGARQGARNGGRTCGLICLPWGPRRSATPPERGLDGIVVSAGKVVLIDRDATRTALEESGLFLFARVL